MWRCVEIWGEVMYTSRLLRCFSVPFALSLAVCLTYFLATASSATFYALVPCMVVIAPGLADRCSRAQRIVVSVEMRALRVAANNRSRHQDEVDCGELLGWAEVSHHRKCRRRTIIRLQSPTSHGWSRSRMMIADACGKSCHSQYKWRRKSCC